MDRRAALSRLAGAGAVGASGALVSSSDAFAAMGSCCTASSSYALIPTCLAQEPAPVVCQDTFVNTISVCRTLMTTQMFLARNSSGTQRPYFDELAWIQVTSPLGVVRSQNFRGWQIDCALPATLGTVSGFNNGNECTTGASTAVNISGLFGTSECGIFSVQIRVRNGFTPRGYSTAYIVPA